jgi:hypothetical protein
MSHTQRQSRLSNVYVTRTASAPTAPEAVDQLDGLMLACASRELPLDALLSNVGCSKRDGLDRIRRLAERGLVTIHRGAASTSDAEQPVVAPEAPVSSAPPRASRVFRKPT